MDLITHAQKVRKEMSAEKKKVDRLAKQRSWNHSMKRVQRYLGLRQVSGEKEAEIARAGLPNSGLEWNSISVAQKAATNRYVLLTSASEVRYERNCSTCLALNGQTVQMEVSNFEGLLVQQLLGRGLHCCLLCFDRDPPEDS